MIIKNVLFLPHKRTDIETKKMLEDLAGHIRASKSEELVSADSLHSALSSLLFLITACSHFSSFMSEFICCGIIGVTCLALQVVSKMFLRSYVL